MRAPAGAYSYMASQPITAYGNNVAFNDPILTEKEYLIGVAANSILSWTGGVLTGKLLGLPWVYKPTPVKTHINPVPTKGHTQIGGDDVIPPPNTKQLGTTRDNMLNSVSDKKLENIVNDLYRPNAKIGSGSSMDAYRYEKVFSVNVGGKTHHQKVLNYRSALLKMWNKRNTLTPEEQEIVKKLLIDIQDALSNY